MWGKTPRPLRPLRVHLPRFTGEDKDYAHAPMFTGELSRFIVT